MERFINLHYYVVVEIMDSRHAIPLGELIKKKDTLKALKPVDYKILQIFWRNRNKPLLPADIINATALSKSAVYDSLKRLKDLGIIDVEIKNGVRFYVLRYEQKKPEQKQEQKQEQSEEITREITTKEVYIEEYPSLEDLDVGELIEWVREHEVYGADRIVRRIGLLLKAGVTSIVLYGAPGDGKSTICQLILEYIKERYGVDYIFLNIDESTTAYHLIGGFSPEALKMGKKIIHYGVIPRALLERKHVFLDELNRTDFRNISKLMGFYAAPYKLVIQESGEVFTKPKWFVTLATMNIGDEGNFSLSRAFKRRFAILKVAYNRLELDEILRSIPETKDDQELQEICKAIYEETWKWANEKLVLFGVGIAHLRNFARVFKVFQKDMDFDDALREAFKITVLMQIIDENDIYRLEEIERKAEEFLNKIVSIRKTPLFETSTSSSTTYRRRRYR